MTESHHHASDCTHCGNHAHLHLPDEGKPQRLLLFALLLILSFAAAEWLIGLTSHSLTLMADSGHMASDGVAIALAVLAVWLSKRAKTEKQAWENWAALLNGLALGGISCWILWEAVSRFHHPVQEIASMPVLITAGIGAVVNGINVKLLHPSSHASLNLRAAFLHVLADTVSSIGVILAAIAIAVFHWFWVDGAVSLMVSLFILYNAILVVHQTLQALRQNYPANLKDFTKNEV